MAEFAGAVAAIGLVSNCLQYLEFGVKVAKQTYKLVKSGDDAIRENIEVEQMLREYEAMADNILDTVDPAGPPLMRNCAKLAHDCKKRALRLLQLLEDLKVDPTLRGPKRIYHTAGKVRRATHLRREIEKEMDELRDKNAKVGSCVVGILRSEQEASFQKLAERLQRGDENCVANVLEAKSEIIRTIQGAVDKKKIHTIIDSLRFPEMRSRRAAISKAHAQTYSWAFDQDVSTFTSWLESSSDLFWITGKAGSGKSTFMKYLSRHPMTKRRLEVWSGGEEAVTVDFYFWYLGTAMQKSIHGLLQSILHQILSACPHLVPTLIPDRYTAEKSFHRNPDPWTEEELNSILKTIAHSNEMTKKTCFFIDGLDEYHGDHRILVSLLKDLSKHPCIKLVVSSRPWNVFDRAFSEIEDTLLLENLTRNDIRLYVNEQLEELCGSKDFEALVFEVADKAQGVFLWVFLVVSSLRRGLDEGDGVAILRRRLEDFPSDLEEYFALILSRVDTVYKGRTAQCLKLAVLLQDQADFTFATLYSFLAYWLIDDGMEDADFGLRAKVRQFSEEDVSAAAERVRKFLSATCKDLLYLVQTDAVLRGKRSSPTKWRVDFLHRTVYDFLKSEQIETLFQKQLPPHFEAPCFWQDLALAYLKIVPPLVFEYEAYLQLLKQNLRQLRYQDHREAYLEQLEQVSLYYIRRRSALGNAKCDGCVGELSLRIKESQSLLCKSTCPLHCIAQSVFIRYPDWVHGSKLHPWPMLPAVLGQLQPRTFRVDMIDSGLVHMLLKAGCDPNEFHPDLNQTTWGLFLQRWIVDTHSEDSEVQMPSMENGWLIADLCIRHGADVSSRFPWSSSPAGKAQQRDGGVEHRYSSLTEIVAFCAPPLRQSEISSLVCGYSSSISQRN